MDHQWSWTVFQPPQANQTGGLNAPGFDSTVPNRALVNATIDPSSKFENDGENIAITCNAGDPPTSDVAP